MGVWRGTSTTIDCCHQTVRVVQLSFQGLAYWCLNIFGSSLEKICRKLKQSWLEFSVVLKSVSFTLLCRDQTLSVSVSDGIRNKIEREPQREAAVSFRTVVTFVT